MEEKNTVPNKIRTAEDEKFLEDYKKRKEKKTIKISLIGLVIIGLIIIILGTTHSILLDNAKDKACNGYQMNYQKGTSFNEFCIIKDRAINVLFDCKGLFKHTCEVKFIIAFTEGTG